MYTINTIAKHLKKRPSEMAELVELHGLPVVHVPAKTKPVRKVLLSAYHRWICERCENCRPTIQEIREELREIESK